MELIYPATELTAPDLPEVDIDIPYQYLSKSRKLVFRHRIEFSLLGILHTKCSKTSKYMSFETRLLQQPQSSFADNFLLRLFYRYHLSTQER